MATNPRFLTTAPARAEEIDVGLRQYMLRVYNYMALGVAGTGIVSLAVALNPDIMAAVALGPMKWVLFVGIIGLGFMAPRVILRSSAFMAHGAYWLYAGLWGALLAPMFYRYTGESIVEVFFITAAMFAGMSLYGYTTKRDLSAIGRFLVLATFGLLFALFANIFIFQSGGFHLIMSFVVVLVFAGLTAYQTQMIMDSYYQMDSGELVTRKAIFGAFLLYGCFVTMFIWMLTIFGVARD